MEQPQPSESPAGRSPLFLDDPWEPSRRIPLDGSLERRRFPPWLLVLIVLVGGFIIFQVVGAIATLALLLAQGASLDDLLDFESLLQNNAHSLLAGNTIGQIFALALPVWLLVYLHSRRNLSFLRFRTPGMGMMGLSVVGLAALMPITWWLGSLNELLPLPDWLEQIEASQIDLIEQVFLQDLSLAFLLVTMSVTPAICEEIVFRGYIQRQLERTAGVVGGIVLTGIIFGFFHLRLTQALPLAAIGMYLAYITWRSGSIWPAIVVHFANNAFTITLGKVVSLRSDVDLESLERMDVPAGILIVCVAAFATVIYYMHRRATYRILQHSEFDDHHHEGEFTTS